MKGFFAALGLLAAAACWTTLDYVYRVALVSEGLLDIRVGGASDVKKEHYTYNNVIWVLDVLYLSTLTTAILCIVPGYHSAERSNLVLSDDVIVTLVIKLKCFR